MKLEGVQPRFEGRLQSAGIGRFFSGTFLGVWLVGWALGELFALSTLVAGAWSLFTGRPPGVGRAPLTLELALPIGLFLLLWLTLWSLGGVLATRELLRLLFGHDRLRVQDDALEIEHHFGLFRSHQTVKCHEVRRFYRSPGGAALCVETTRGTTELSRLGSVVERAELARALNAQFALEPEAASNAALPEAWCETSSLEHDHVLVKNPATRRQQALIMWIVCAASASVAFYMAFTAQRRPELSGHALLLAAIASAFAWGAAWLSFGRDEWKLENGRLSLQRRFGTHRTTRFEASGLELLEDNSGEGGPTYQLIATAADAHVSRQTQCYHSDKHRHIIHSQSDDPTVARQFGLWLSQRCELSFIDRTSTEEKALQLEALKQHLAASGRFGRVLAHIIQRFAPSRTTGDR